VEISFFDLKIFINIPLRSIGILIILIILTILAYFLMIKIRKKRVLKFSNYPALKKIYGSGFHIPHPGILILKILLISLIFLVATQSIQLNIVKPIANADFVLVIDNSPTLLMPDYYPNRLEIAKELSLKWVSKLPGATKIGIVTFSDRVKPLSPLTTNVFEIENKIKSITVNLNSSGKAIGDALELATSMLSQSEKQRFVILITDGKSNIGKNVSEVLEDCKNNKVVIYSIGIGKTEESVALFEKLKDIVKDKNISITFPEIDEEELKFISDETGGKFFLANSPEKIDEALKDIVIKNERIPLNSDYYMLIFISFLLILELIVYSKLGAI